MAQQPVSTGLGPVANARTRVLVLGSFPGQASLVQQAYYAHPRNAFWPIMERLCTESLMPLPFSDRYRRLMTRGIGLWDVYASCERAGSLDSAIRDAVVNPLADLVAKCPALRLIAHNGAESAKHMRHTRDLGVAVVQLPSTSPANARMRFDDKLALWTAALQTHLYP